jgi:Domain of unknown function DUF29
MSESKATAAHRPKGASAGSAMISYDADVILWSKQQARLLRAGRFAELDIVRLADEIEDVGKSEKREFVSRMGVLLAHLLKWSRQPTKRSPSWRSTIVDQRKRVALAIRGTPSLRAVMRDPDWREDIWLDARAQARKETGLGEDELPEACPWTMDQATDPDFWPE